MRAAKIRTAKLDAMAEGRPYKPTRVRRRRSRWAGYRDPDFVPIAHRPLEPRPSPVVPMGPGLEAWGEAMELADGPGRTS